MRRHVDAVKPDRSRSNKIAGYITRHPERADERRVKFRIYDEEKAGASGKMTIAISAKAMFSEAALATILARRRCNLRPEVLN